MTAISLAEWGQYLDAGATTYAVGSVPPSPRCTSTAPRLNPRRTNSTASTSSGPAAPAANL